MTVTEELTTALWERANDSGAPPDESLAVVLATGLTAAVLGRHADAVDLAVEVGAQYGGVGRSTVPGRYESLDPVAAATATGVAVTLGGLTVRDEALDLDALAPLTAAVWSVGTDRDRPLGEWLRALEAGLAAQRAIAAAMQPDHARDGWDASTTTAVLGCAYAAGHLVGCGPRDLAQVVGVAASQSLGMGSAVGTPLGLFHRGKAAAHAVLSAYLVEQGFTGSTRVLEAPRGWFAVMMGDASRAEGVVSGRSATDGLTLGSAGRGRASAPCSAAGMDQVMATASPSATAVAAALLDTLTRPGATASDLLTTLTEAKA